MQKQRRLPLPRKGRACREDRPAPPPALQAALASRTRAGRAAAPPRPPDPPPFLCTPRLACLPARSGTAPPRPPPSGGGGARGAAGPAGRPQRNPPPLRAPPAAHLPRLLVGLVGARRPRAAPGRRGRCRAGRRARGGAGRSVARPGRAGPPRRRGRSLLKGRRAPAQQQPRQAVQNGQQTPARSQPLQRCPLHAGLLGQACSAAQLPLDGRVPRGPTPADVRLCSPAACGRRGGPLALGGGPYHAEPPLPQGAVSEEEEGSQAKRPGTRPGLVCLVSSGGGEEAAKQHRQAEGAGEGGSAPALPPRKWDGRGPTRAPADPCQDTRALREALHGQRHQRPAPPPPAVEPQPERGPEGPGGKPPALLRPGGPPPLSPRRRRKS